MLREVAQWPPLIFIVRTAIFVILAYIGASHNETGNEVSCHHDNVDLADIEYCSSAIARDGCHGYVTFQRSSEIGWPPIILSAPHAGYLSPSTIPDRDAGCWDEMTSQCVWSHDCGVKNATACKATIDDDFSTHLLAVLVRQHLCQLFNGHCPALVLNNLARSKFDANRDKAEATFGVPEVERAFDEYHERIERSKRLVVERNGVGLFVDLHGQSHGFQRAELGYLLRSDVLNSEQPLQDPSASSIRSLSLRHPHIDFDNLVRGPLSFGALIEESGFAAVPSPIHRGPGLGNPYYNGGYLTRRHGSQQGGTVDAFQIESSSSSRAPEVIESFAKALAESMRRYVCLYYYTSSDEPTSSHADCQRDIW